MQPLSCPIPADLDVLKNNGFRFNVAKLAEVTYFCQEVSLPNLSLPSAMVPTPLVDWPVAGDKLNFGPLGISFLISSTMANYMAVNAWLVGLGFPQKHEQYAAFLRTFGTNLERSPLAISESDATLEILNGTNGVSQTIRFVGCHPTSLSGVNFATDVSDITYMTANATFDYSYYYFE